MCSPRRIGSDSDLALYGVDFEGPPPSERYNDVMALSDMAVVLPDLAFAMPNEVFESLKLEIDPLADSDSNGIDIYLKARNFIRAHHMAERII